MTALAVSPASEADELDYDWVDVWRLDESQNGRRLKLHHGDRLHIQLTESPATGYIWVAVETAGGVVDLITQDFSPARNDSENLIGGDGTRNFWLQVVGVGRGELKLVLRRPWLLDDEPEAIFSVNVEALLD